MSIQLRPIDKTNWAACVALQIHESQQGYLPSNAYSLAESKYTDHMETFGVYHDEQMVGFAAYVLDESGDMNITRFMIDQAHQGKGYGKAALQEVIKQIQHHFDNKEVWLSLHPENHTAIRLYTAAGFEITEVGLESADEIFLKLTL